MKKSKKVISIIFLISTLFISNLIAQSISFNISEGDYNNISLYNEFGRKRLLTSNNNINITGKTILKTSENKIKINYNFGELEIFENTILVIDPYQVEPILYLIDGQITLSTDSLFVKKYQILTPVSKYEFNSPAKINVISSEELEYGIFYKGNGTSYNALTNETTYLNSAQLIDMSFDSNITLNIPQDYLTAGINVNENDEIIKLIRSEYAYQEAKLLNENKEKSIKLREEFLNDNYLLGIKPIQKSNNFENLTTVNFIITGNGQGNIEAIDLSSLSGIIKTAQNNNENILLIDAGNTLRGSSYVNFDKGKTAAKILDMIGYDIFVPGAIDFSNGINNLRQYDKASSVNYISSNALNDESLFYFNPFGLYLFDDFKIAVLGLSNPSDLSKLNNIDLTNNLILENAQKAIDEAHKVADYVILVSNINYNNYNTTYILNNVKGINLLIDGNSNDATLINLQNVPVIKTGVGYSEIQNYKINVKKDTVVSTNYAKVYSSNLNEDNNKLLTSLNLKTFDKDVNLVNYMSLIKVPSNISKFLISPEFTSSSTTIKDLKIKTTISDKKIEIPNEPSFKDKVQIDEIVKEVPNEPILEKVIVNIPTPKFSPISYKVKKQESIEEKATDNIPAPKFSPISYKVKKQEPIIDAETMSDSTEIQEEGVTEKTDTSNEILQEPKLKADIYSGEDTKIKAHIGLNTTLEGNIEFNDSSLTNNSYSASAYIYPYFYRGGFSLALKLQGDLDNSYNLSTPLYPFPSSTIDRIDYSLNILDHFKFYSASDRINIDINRNNLTKDIDSAIIYDELGDSKLHFKSRLNNENFAFSFYLSNLNIYQPLNDVTSETSYINLEFKSIDIFNFKIGAIAIGNSSNLNIYPSINFDLIPVNNKDLQLKLNLGTSLYFNAIPSVSFTTIINPTLPSLIPNYLINGSLNVNTDKLNLSIGANYLVSEDTTKFSTNLIHKNTIQSSIIQSADSNTLSLIAKIKYENDNFGLNFKYTMPLDISDYSFENDLIDFTLDLNINKLKIGGYYLCNDFYTHLLDIMNIRSFLINSDTEYGGYISYDYNNLTIKSTLTLPSSVSVPMKLSLLMNYKLDYAF